VSQEAHFIAHEPGRARESYNLFHSSLYGVFAGVVDVATCTGSAGHDACQNPLQWQAFAGADAGVPHEATPISDARQRFVSHMGKNGVAGLLDVSQLTQGEYHATRDVAGARRVEHDIFQNYPHGDYVYQATQRNPAIPDTVAVLNWIVPPPADGKLTTCTAEPVNKLWKRVHRKSHLLSYDYWKIEHDVRSCCRRTGGACRPVGPLQACPRGCSLAEQEHELCTLHGIS